LAVRPPKNFCSSFRLLPNSKGDNIDSKGDNLGQLLQVVRTSTMRSDNIAPARGICRPVSSGMKRTP
jgi:hypothetical protein